MKKRVSVDLLLDIENQLVTYRSTGSFDYTLLAKKYPEENSERLSHLIRLAQKMPWAYMVAEIMQYDALHPKMDELLFVNKIKDKCKVSRGDVIERIQHVRRISKQRSDK